MCYLIQWLIFCSFCLSRGSPTCKIVIIKVVVEKIRITYSSLKVYLKSRTCCKRSSAICFLKALPKLFKIVHSAVCINCKYIYLKLVLSCKCNVANATLQSQPIFWRQFTDANATSDNIINIPKLLPKQLEKSCIVVFAGRKQDSLNNLERGWQWFKVLYWNQKVAGSMQPKFRRHSITQMSSIHSRMQ